MSARAEIRAPRAQVLGIAGHLPRTPDWLWAPTQVADPASVRELPDGSRQLVNADGDKLKDRIEEATPDRVVVVSTLVPRAKDRPGRELRYTLSVRPGVGTTQVELELEVAGAAPSAIDQRRWRRHAEQCVARLQGLCEVAAAPVGPSDE